MNCRSLGEIFLPWCDRATNLFVGQHKIQIEHFVYSVRDPGVLFGFVAPFACAPGVLVHLLVIVSAYHFCFVGLHVSPFWMVEVRFSGTRLCSEAVYWL